jgi:hypothetical protein
MRREAFEFFRWENGEAQFLRKGDLWCGMSTSRLGKGTYIS